MDGVRKEHVPAMVAPKSYQAHQRLIPLARPKLARSLEPALILPTGRFDGLTAQRLAPPLAVLIFHPGQIRPEVVDLFLHRRLVLWMQRPRHRPEVFFAVKEVQPLLGSFKPVRHQVPDPDRPVGHY